MYRNAVYNNKSKSIHLWTWDARGNRIYQEIDYKPYLYVEDKKGTATSIYGTALKMREFDTLWDRNKFVKEGNVRRIFENLPPYQQWLIDNYYHECESPEFAAHPLKVMALDIECPANPNVNGGMFSTPENPEQVINLLTCYDSLTKRYTMFGLKAFTRKQPDTDYYHCKSEHDLLKRFIGHFSSDYPDVLTTWNGADFDIPYLINRITFELGKEWADELSPMGRIYEKMNKQGKFGQPTKEYVIEGIACADYYVLYQKFSMEKQESYKLDYVGEVEVGVKKIEHEGTLWELARDDWDTYCEYNYRDVELIVKLDEKLQYISLLRFLAYTGLCSLQSAINTVPVVNGSIAIRAKHRGVKIPTFVGNKDHDKMPGGFVQVPKPGFAKNIVSFDANSLYPSVMISLNLSPETKLGWVEKVGDMVHIHHTSGRIFELTPQKFAVYMKEEKAALSKAGFLFSQKKVGLMPEFLDSLYAKRKAMKDQMKKLKDRLSKERKSLSDIEIAKIESEIQKCNTFQHAYKICLNSVYGYMGNKYAPMGDHDIGCSVTLTGQAINKKNRELFGNFLKEKYGISDEEVERCCLAGDTDSGYFSLAPLERFGIPLKGEDGKISKDFYDICDELEEYINTHISTWVKSSFRSIDSRIVYKREAICDAGILLVGKKNYVLHVLDEEGTQTEKFKYVGVAVVKTTMPKPVKPYVKSITECMILTQSLQETNKLFNEAYGIFNGLDVEDIANNSGMNNYEAYSAKCNGLEIAKKMPFALKAAYHHDLIVERLGLGSKYPKFKSGDKIKILKVQKPNQYNISSIGFRGKFPEEFKSIFRIDYESMFNKVIFKAIGSFYEAVGWKLRKPNENVKVELEDFLGED